MKTKYSHNFYKGHHQNTVYSAKKILEILFGVLPEIRSVADFGCGVGTWLSIIKKMGINDIHGFDGPWVEKSLLQIPQENFQEVNLENELKLDRKYDLAISLEVAEHLRPEVAETFVQSLVNASNFVLFSAAIPLQGGTSHINEQWQSYWVDLFSAKDYVVLDIVRKETWNNEKIPTWYRQNILTFVKKECLDDLNLSGLNSDVNELPISIVHPNSYLGKVSKLTSTKGSLKSFLRAITNTKKL